MRSMTSATRPCDVLRRSPRLPIRVHRDVIPGRHSFEVRIDLGERYACGPKNAIIDARPSRNIATCGLARARVKVQCNRTFSVTDNHWQMRRMARHRRRRWST